ncbi:probable plastid-lipid-associated protein 14, chloroplastic isoform X2 [Macadamia integrifolia]|uniref:probable plastid-lipid-associated protein 14, chloroplastic isoform X2 n=1 Tax=Macadamia integrifolia TaxID=60698 RepID=UPI001C4E91E7|nr:probable plastid-lipid-associated protein 14, chloroplastic isoform X2 [Macadamia integrifolia]
MALCGIGFKPGSEGLELVYLSGNSSKKRIASARTHLSSTYRWRTRWEVRCSKEQAAFPSESKGNVQTAGSISMEEELGAVMKFKMSDFTICDCVSIGLGGRADEVVLEAIVKDSRSPLYNKKVVLRRLTSSQAQRRGRRAIEVLKKLARRRLMYHSYSMQVYGYVSPSTTGDHSSFTLVHGYHGSYSLRHWLQLSDWLPTLEATLALDEESVRKVGDDTIGGPAISRQLRLTRILMRDLLIGVNYLHSNGLAHTELRLENIHISPVDRHIKVGILGNAADFYDNTPNNSAMDGNMERRQMMIAFDMRCVGFMMAKMVLRELMDPLIFMKFKSFLTKGNNPSCLREFLLPILCKGFPSGNAGLQILDRNWGAGWHLLSLLLATKPSERLSCLDCLRHPFLCGPRWRVDASMDIIRWGLGSTAVRITEEYIYVRHQRNRIAYFIELMEMLNPYPKTKNWLKFLPGRWRMLYSTGRHIGLTLRQPSSRVLIGDVHLTVTRTSNLTTTLSISSDICFMVINGRDWPHDKTGIAGRLQVGSLAGLTAGRRLYLKEEKASGSSSSKAQESSARKLPSRKWRRASLVKELPSSLPVANLGPGEVEMTMNLDDPSLQEVNVATNVLREVQLQAPPEMFDLSRIVCGTYVDSRLLVLRGVNGSALLFTRSCV